MFKVVVQSLRVALYASLFAATLSGCTSTPRAQVGPVAATVDAESGQAGYSAFASSEYRLRPLDRIAVSVFREPDLSLESLNVSPSGEIALPLVGTLQVAGMTTGEIEQMLETAYGARYLRHPDVAVNILAYESHRVTVEGEVKEPGVYQFQPGARLSSGISLAQGVTRTARRSEVAVFRQSDEGMMIAKFDYAAIQAGTMLDPILQPGDRVVVGTDSLAQVWRDVLGALPAFALFQNIGI